MKKEKKKNKYGQKKRKKYFLLTVKYKKECFLIRFKVVLGMRLACNLLYKKLIKNSMKKIAENFFTKLSTITNQ